MKLFEVVRPPTGFQTDIVELVAKVEKAGYVVTRSTVLTLRATVLDTLKVMHKLKMTSVPAIPANPKAESNAKAA